ncbi:AI-2E family transporter [Candidatus Daviesbacteria bacterium]|nr:AI-2E family transporter [Candidatus Daviesbacteria bacterium]
MNKRVDISYKTIFFIAGFLASIWILFQIRGVIILLFIAIIFMSALSPIVGYLERLKLPRTLSIIVIYILIIGALAGLISLIITPLVEQTTNLAQNLPQTIGKLIPAGSIDQTILQNEISAFSKNALSFILAIFNNFVALISVLVLTFYLLLERSKLDQLITQFFIGREEERIKTIIDRIEDKLGAWMRGQIALSFIIGLLVYITLFVLNVPYALPLSILAGILEVVPVIGPIISAIPAIAIAYVSSPILALVVAAAFFIIQQLENHFIVPQVMKRAVGLNPLVVILAVASGGKLLGISGALLAVPIAVVIQIITQDILRGEKID